ncbi:MAG: hypothetical protein VCA36_08290, partial [Opitutales bacterium]
MKALLAWSLVMVVAQGLEPVKLQLDTLAAIEGSAKWDWWQARSAYVPGTKPIWITTMSETGKTGTHNFHDVYQSISRDGGLSW